MKKVPPKKKRTYEQDKKRKNKPKRLTRKKVKNVKIAKNEKKRINKSTKQKEKSVKDSKRVKQKKHSKKKRKTSFLKQVMIELLVTFGIAVVLLTLVSHFTIALPSIEGYSMTPTIDNGERVLVNKLGKIKRFSLVYFRIPGKKELAVRRVIGLPKEEVKYKNDQLLVNSEEIPERFLTEQKNDAKQQSFLFTTDFSVAQKTNQQTIPSDGYLVLGDNRLYATDSRQFGLINRKDIVGVVEARIFPLTRF
ncbi:signal peptidase I [Candidatus Enterococcus mansonii]|uniref:Signal peptidase I n=1 Tax=Candidatus Enterococcus mansonii TaxID=1834181 RepID=A0A242CCV5_9ENTE|nr:signal peptidase I [Enterococcus sp. 4G2_DIV0659]OTO08077.1 hypothetical protein A5880_002347 [Enterococcus sp. 4G2_DIV0659]